MTAGAMAPQVNAQATLEQYAEEWETLRTAREKLWLRRGAPLPSLSPPAPPSNDDTACARTDSAPPIGGCSLGCARSTAIKGVIKLSPLPAIARDAMPPATSRSVVAQPDLPLSAAATIVGVPDAAPAMSLPLFQRTPASIGRDEVPAAAGGRAPRCVRWSHQASVKRYERESEPWHVRSQPEDCEAIVSPVFQGSWESDGEDPMDGVSSADCSLEIFDWPQSGVFRSRADAATGADGDVNVLSLGAVRSYPAWEQEVDEELERALQPRDPTQLDALSGGAYLPLLR